MVLQCKEAIIRKNTRSINVKVPLVEQQTHQVHAHSAPSSSHKMQSSSAGSKRSATPDDIQEMPPQEMPRARPRRSAATKASTLISEVARSETKPEQINMPTGDLLAEALAPIREDEQDEWKAWVEIESEPVRFSSSRWRCT